MALVTETGVQIFDLTQINRGDLVRIKRAGDTTYKNGFVTQVNNSEMQILYCNTQNNATSYIKLLAVDVAIGVWEVWYTADMQTVNHENNAP